MFAVAVIALGIAAVAGWRWAGYLLIAALGLRLAAHLAAGYAGFRNAMSRPWPRVAPLSDDDDWP